MNRARLASMGYRLLSAVGWAAVFRRRNQAVVFCFHNVVRDESGIGRGERALHMPVRRFEEHLDWIFRQYTIVSLEELLARIESGRAIGGVAVLTFDDGYSGIFDNALPVLARYGLPATVFVVPSAADEGEFFWWDLVAEGRSVASRRDQLLEKLNGDGRRILSEPGLEIRGSLPDELRAASWPTIADGAGPEIAIGSHTLTHRNLESLTSGSVHQEIRAARNQIRERLGVEPIAISYPYGRAGEREFSAAADAGYRAGVTLRFGTTSVGEDPFRLPRVNVPADLPGHTLECWAAGLRFTR